MSTREQNDPLLCRGHVVRLPDLCPRCHSKGVLLCACVHMYTCAVGVFFPFHRMELNRQPLTSVATDCCHVTGMYLVISTHNR